MKFIDTHIHCVNNIDDGSQSIADSIEMLEMEYNQGVRNIFCTVHSGVIDNMQDEAAAFDNMILLLNEFQEKTGHYDLNLRMITEIDINQDNFEECFLYQRKIVPWYRPICNKFYLFEFNYRESAENMIDIAKKLISRGVIPVIAHAERYINILDAIDALKKMGCIIQVNIGSFIRGGFLAYVDVATTLLKNNQIDILGTDAHRINWRPPIIIDGYNIIREIVSEEQLNAICYDNAAKIFDME